MTKKFLYLICLTFVFSIKAEGKLASVNNIDIWWEGFGNNNHTPVILIMGINTNSKRWPLELINGLVENNLYVIIFDNRDSGKSTWLTKEPLISKFIKYTPRALKEYLVNEMFKQDEDQRFEMGGTFVYNLNDMAKDTISLMNYLNINQAHVVGASMGGMIGQVIALDYPERVLTLTSIMSTPGFDTEGLPGPTSEYMEALRESIVLGMEGKHKESLRLVYKSALGSKYPFDEERFERMLAIRMDHGNNLFSGHTMAVGASPNRYSRLNEILKPTLIIHGNEDPLIPVEHGLATASQIQNSEVIIMEGVGHNFPLPTVPDLVKGMVNHFNKIQ